MNNFVKRIMLSLFSIAVIANLTAMEQADVIVKVSGDASIKFDGKGHFANSSDAIKFLKKAAKKGKISHGFKKIQEAKALLKEAKTAKWATEQLFLVKCENGNSYIIKEIKQDKNPRDEIKRLERAHNARRMQPYIYPNKTDGLQFVFPTNYIQYTHNNKEHILVIMPKAKGKSLQSIMERFSNSPDDDKLVSLACAAYYDLGMAIAKFYQSQGTINSTLTHGDFHHGNIFYDEDSRLVTLIDNERLCKALKKPADISSDLSHLFVTSPFIMEWSNSGFMKTIDFKRWYKITLSSFIIGFIRVYPKQERLDIFKKLKDLLLKWNCAVKKDDSKEIRGIIKEVLIINEKDGQNLEQQLFSECKTELHIAAGNSDLVTLVEIMLNEKTTAIDKKDLDGNTPLHEAAYFDSLKAAKLLIHAGAKVNAHNNQGETPLFKAKYKNNHPLIALLANI